MFGGSLLEHVTWTKSLANSSNVLKDHVLVRLMLAKLREADADLRSNILAGGRCFCGLWTQDLLFGNLRYKTNDL